MHSRVVREKMFMLYHRVNKGMGKCSVPSGVQRQAYSNSHKVHFAFIKSTKTKGKPDANMATLKLINSYLLLVAHCKLVKSLWNIIWHYLAKVTKIHNTP